MNGNSLKVHLYVKGERYKLKNVNRYNKQG